MFSPLLQYVTQVVGINLQSGKPYTNPHAFSMAGQKFRNEDGNAEKIDRQGLPLENALLQPVFPRIAQTMKAINAGEFRPTDQTSVLPFGDAAIQRTREFPDGVKAMEPWQRFVFGFVKLNATPQIYDRESQENMDRREARKFIELSASKIGAQRKMRQYWNDSEVMFQTRVSKSWVKIRLINPVFS